jgi:CRP/FNR family cyclic AMP-dependent transcriptional regulator
MSASECQQCIARSSWFEGAPEEVLAALAAGAVVRSLPPNAYLWTMGESNTEVFGLISGRVRMALTSEMGHEFALVDRERDSWMGEPCLTNDLGRASEARTLVETKFVAIPRKVVLDAADAWPLIYRNLFNSVIPNQRGMYELLAGALFYPLRARVAGRLLELLKAHGKAVEGGMLLDLKLSQNDFARLAMGSRQRVNRIFREWDKLGVVVMRSDKLLISNMEALSVEIVPFD